jgi:hypothetical protein
MIAIIGEPDDETFEYKDYVLYDPIFNEFIQEHVMRFDKRERHKAREKERARPDTIFTKHYLRVQLIYVKFKEWLLEYYGRKSYDFNIFKLYMVSMIGKPVLEPYGFRFYKLVSKRGRGKNEVSEDLFDDNDD